MTPDPAIMQLECTLAIARCLEADPLLCDPWALACAMFFAGVDAQAAEPRALATVEAELLTVRERAGYQQVRTRRVPNFGGSHHAQHRRPESPTDAPSRRKGDQADAALAADVEAEARLARNRDRARRADADQHSGQ